ncbi:hypothetical protein [Actinoplanes sp. NBRC 103695]|uniref:hypothetical protein n=1 Tax=Actinoplanes sp. NBRC 103695 TaxID=3032202 RepID=UPI0024A2AC18|nr:hypothetical protein [Actinoplanes sp. NBRC 103695]GLY97813.1 hypothetical protein Acsp02_50670 [Actinoplanes sp. NBRC 103695]
MGVFTSERRIWTDVTDLRPVVDRIMQHFRAKNYVVAATQTGTGGWDVGITRSGVLRTVAGLRTDLKVRLEPEPGRVLARAGVGLFGQLALPTVIMFIFWPVIVTQVWGIVLSARVDDEAMTVIDDALTRAAAIPAPVPATGDCPGCGAPHGGGSFCTGCGHSYIV